ncbi:MAG TPA: YtxH domain-containing protein [Candidatus Dormibacteraeota bacterium]|nr:YtxH domain-containing protein [Candidatus Dormibacteraeota bacterium]
MGKKGHGRGLIKGTLFGAIVGSVAALLLAPKSGKETQADLKDQAKKIKKDMDQKLLELEGDLNGRIDSLKSAAKDLKGEAYEESQRLITKAEILKQDLKDSAGRLGKISNQAKDETMTDVKRLVNEGTAIMNELEKTTRQIIRAARDKAIDEKRSDKKK